MFYANNFCTYTEDIENYIYKGPCHKCKKEIIVKVPKDALYKYNQGAYIQDAMPTVSSGDREFLMTGICDSCFKRIAKEPED